MPEEAPVTRAVLFMEELLMVFSFDRDVLAAPGWPTPDRLSRQLDYRHRGGVLHEIPILFPDAFRVRVASPAGIPY